MGSVNGRLKLLLAGFVAGAGRPHCDLRCRVRRTARTARTHDAQPAARSGSCLAKSA
ncbi:hypothetical protein NKH18_44825 [Streptomyces sp. M10(2022)]